MSLPFSSGHHDHLYLRSFERTGIVPAHIRELYNIGFIIFGPMVFSGSVLAAVHTDQCLDDLSTPR